MFPQINPSVKCAFRWYRDPAQRTRHTIQCKESVETCPWAFVMARQVISPFEIIAGIGITFGQSTPISWKIYTLAGVEVENLTPMIDALQVERFANPNREYIILDEELTLDHDDIASFSEGLYEMEIVTAGGTFYSETFRFCNDTDCMYKITYRSCGDVGTQRYAYRDFTNVVYFEASKVEIGRPLPVTKEETEEDDSSEDVTVFVRKDVNWSAVFSGLPWYALDAITEIPLHDTITLRIPNATGADTLTNVSVEASWPEKDSCEAFATMKFRVDEGAMASGCCASFDPPCVTSCVTAAGILGVHTPSLGQVFLMDRKNYGTYVGEDSPENRQDGFGFLTACPSGFATTTAVGYEGVYWNGSEWFPAIYILDASCDEDGLVFLTGNAWGPYGIQVQYSVNGSTWVDLPDVYSSGELGSGITVEVPDAAIHLRLKLVGTDCTITTSASILMPCSACSGSNVFMFSATGVTNEVVASTTTGYFSVSIAGVVTTYGDGDAMDVISGEVGGGGVSARTLCIYPSDADGNKTGAFTLIDLDSENIVSVSPGSHNSLETLNLGSNPIASVDISNCNNALTTLGLDGCAIASSAAIDAIYNALDATLPGGQANTSGGTNADPTAASLTNRNALTTNGWMLTT